MLYPDSLPYMRTITRKVSLYPGYELKGEKVSYPANNKGNLVFLLSNSIDNSIRMMDQKRQCYANGHYRYYFYKARFAVKIKKKLYRINDVKDRDKIYKRIAKETTIHPYPKSLVIRDSEVYNTYFDLFRYLDLFHIATGKLNTYRRIEAFWNLMIPLFTDNYGKLKNKMVLMDISMYPFDMRTNIQQRINNPAYMLYFTLYKRYNMIKDLDIDFILYNNAGQCLRINPSKVEEGKHLEFLQQLRKLYSKDIPEVSADDERSIEAEEETVDVENQTTENEIIDIPSVISTDIGTNSTSEESSVDMYDRTTPKADIAPSAINSVKTVGSIVSNDEKLREKVEAKIEDAKKALTSAQVDENKSEITPEKVAETINEEINNDSELISEIYNKMMSETPRSSEKSTARDAMLREKQKELIVRGTTVEDLRKIDARNTKIESNNISNSISTTNPNMKEIKFQNFNESYVKNVMDKDIVGVFEKLNEVSTKMYILKIDVEDTSDVLNYKETWTVHLEDENRQRHTIKVDIPKFYDKNFMWIGGNKKNIKNQNFFLPVVKISNDTVMIVTNYNKMTVKRNDSRSTRELTLIEKRLTSNPDLQKYFKPGSGFIENHDYITILEYDEYSKRFAGFKCGNTELIFSQKKAIAYAELHDIKIPEGKMFIGVEGKDPVYIDLESGKTEDGRGVSDILMDALPEDEVKAIISVAVPKRLMYTSITTMKQDCPMMILMCLWEGLSTALKKSGIEFRLANNKRDISPNEDFLKFADCYLIYKADIKTQLLMNGLKTLKTNEYPIESYDTSTPYMEFVEKKYGKLSILNALNNVYEFTIGNIEKEILTQMNLPTDLVSLMVYANSLLVDNQYVSELDMSEYRVRCAEVIPAILYDCIAKAYVPYKNSNGTKKLSIAQDAVIKKLLALTTVEDYSSLNPFLELETTHGVSTKGWRGVNLEDSYTVPKRSYDDSMIGIIGVSSSPDGQVGVNRSLTMEPNIDSVRGYVNVKSDNLDEIKDVNLFSPAEMLIPLGASRDDPIRTGHSVKQSRAIIPTKHSSPVLMSNGSDEICKYYLSSDFVVNAEEDGEVVEINEKTHIMIVKYKSGKHRAINLDKNLVKNGGGGFELSNVLITDYKVGDKFKANDTLAWHQYFFKKFPGQGVRLCVGTLVKVAIYSSYNTYEDADFITEEVAHLAETEMCFRYSATIGKHSNIVSMVKVGDEVKVGDPLLTFDQSFDDSDINKLLDSLGGDEELINAVTENSHNQMKAKCSGTIEEIKIYSASDLEELQPSVQKVVGDYYKKIDAKNKLLSKYDDTNSIVKCGLMINESSGKTEPDRYGNIRGEKVNDGVLIEFYIKHAEPLEVGSKVANFSPLKNIVSEVIPKGYEPTSEFRPNEHVGTTISPSSILNRMVSSVLPTIFGNKVIIELKRRLEEIWIGDGELATKRKTMCSTIYKVFGALDKTGANTKKYKEMFEPMSDTKFKSFFTDFFNNPDHYLILDVVDYERDVMVEDIEKAAKIINVPLFEKVAFPHYTMDAENPIVTKEPVPVGYIHLKRPQQTVMKKNGMATSSDARSAFTGQVTGADKNGRESDLENCMLVSLGMEKSLKELNGPRADDLVMKREMLQSIATKGYVQLGELTDSVENKTTLNTVDMYFLGMMLSTDLTHKGLRLPYVTDKE